MSNKSNYTVRTISVAKAGRVIEEYYVGNCRKTAIKELQSLQKLGVNKIEMVDNPNGFVYQYLNKNSYNDYRIIKTPI